MSIFTAGAVDTQNGHQYSMDLSSGHTRQRHGYIQGWSSGH